MISTSLQYDVNLDKMLFSQGVMIHAPFAIGMALLSVVANYVRKSFIFKSSKKSFYMSTMKF